MPKITQKELVGVLLGTAGARPVTFLARVDARCRKNKYGKIFKVAKYNGIVNLSYSKTVERARIKEGKNPKFSQGESWHEPVVPEGKWTPLCVHKHDNNKAYLRVVIERTLGKPIYFTEGGDEIDKEQIEGYLPKPNGYKNQGLEKPRRFITVDLDNLLEVTVDGTVYIIEE